MLESNSPRPLRWAAVLVALFATLYVGVNAAWLVRPWGNKLPSSIVEAEYIVLGLTAVAATLAASGRIVRGLGVALLGYVGGLALLLLVVNIAWPNTIIGCYQDQWEWVCPGPLPVVTEGWGAVSAAVGKLPLGTLVAAMGAVAAAALRWALGRGITRRLSRKK